MDITLQTATPRDLAAVDALLARSYPVLLKPDYSPSTLILALPIISRARPELLASGTYYLAYLDGGLAGAGGWTRANPTGVAGPATTAHIRHVVTDPAQTRRGVGRAVLAHVAEQARASGITRLDCLSTRTAVPFYAACGFDARGARTVPLRPGIDFPAVHMTRDLG